jgi:hypothetical protein
MMLKGENCGAVTIQELVITRLQRLILVESIADVLNAKS